MHSPLAPAAAWTTRLAPGDVVSFRFPVDDPGRGAREKKRPCLVLDLPVIAGRRHAWIAYGTSVRSRANRGHELRVRRPEGMARAGLHRATRFVGARSVIVPLDDPRFVVCAATGAPVLGRLDAALRARLAQVRAAAPVPDVTPAPDGRDRHAPARLQEAPRTAPGIVPTTAPA